MVETASHVMPENFDTDVNLLFLDTPGFKNQALLRRRSLINGVISAYVMRYCICQQWGPRPSGIS
jgi:hypothetical protein